ncbi:ATP-dependent DNA ligase [Streptomyces sp. NPDC058657]|uniref:ATP-dependent DNA ligase n=1 Tax=unclassified Streptomyces TaxID=2593676 RepID=UPI00364BF089
MENDGDRLTIERAAHHVVVRSKSGRVVTGAWLDLAAAAMDLPSGVLLDGEGVIYRDGRLDFGAVRQRASAGAARAAALIRRLPASYAAFDILRHPAHGGLLTARPYRERRRILVESLAPLGPPLQAVPMTEDLDVARLWREKLRPQGIEGLVLKRLDGAFLRGRTEAWLKIRHADTVDAVVVGYTGTPAYPAALVVRLPEGREMRSRRLTAPVRRDIAAHLQGQEPSPSARTEDGDPYTLCPPELLVEVLAGTTRHATVTVTRVRGEQKERGGGPPGSACCACLVLQPGEAPREAPTSTLTCRVIRENRRHPAVLRQRIYDAGGDAESSIVTS